MAKLPKYTYAAAFTAFFAVAVAAGCFPAANKQALGPAPAVDADAPDAETAYWRAQYAKNRTI
ncbi:MAG: hypothetical protein LBS30_03270, partial [Planctomycetota bacterium]|nr:hypothetical protein [Planctomycetota bacterium]